MKSRLSLKPGQKGTKLLTERFGNTLLYVRYRYDEERGVRMKTVELVIEEKPWHPSPRLKSGDPVLVAVEYAEKELRERVKAAGGKWDPTVKCGGCRTGRSRGRSWRRGSPRPTAKANGADSGILYKMTWHLI